MGRLRRVAHRKLARRLSDHTGAPWRSRGWRDSSRFVEGQVDGRRVGISVWTYFLSGAPTSTLFVPLARDPGRFELMTGLWQQTFSTPPLLAQVDEGPDEQHTVFGEDATLVPLLADAETLRWLRETSSFFVLKVRPAGPVLKEWSRDPTPSPLTSHAALVLSSLAEDAPSDDYLAAFRRLLVLAGRLEALA